MGGRGDGSGPPGSPQAASQRSEEGAPAPPAQARGPARAPQSPPGQSSSEPPFSQEQQFGDDDIPF